MSDPVDPSSVVVVGRVGGGYGVHGWVRLASYTDPAANILDYDPWLLETARGWRRVEVLEVRAHRGAFVARLDGIADRDAADALRGSLVGVPREQLPAPAEDEYYWRDLIGLEVRDEAGRVRGTVQELIETGANDVLVVRAAGVPDPVLVPFDRQFVLAVDLGSGRITVDWDSATESI